MQHRGDGGADADDADPPGRSYGSLFRQIPLGKPGQHAQYTDDDNAHADKSQIFADLYPQFIHSDHLG